MPHKDPQKAKDYSKQYYQKNKERVKNYREEHKDKIREYNKKYREKHKDELREYNKKYMQTEAGKQSKIKRDKKYWEKHKDKIREYKKNYYEKNKDKLKDKQKNYYETHKMVIAEGRERNIKKGFIPLMPDIFPKDMNVNFHHIENDKPFVVPLPDNTHNYVGGSAKNDGHCIFCKEMANKIYGMDFDELIGGNV